MVVCHLGWEGRDHYRASGPRNTALEGLLLDVKADEQLGDVRNLVALNAEVFKELSQLSR